MTCSMKWIRTRNIIFLILLLTLSSCAAVIYENVGETYVSSWKNVLSISGNTAECLHGSFSIDAPVQLDKIYENEEGATLKFVYDGTKKHAVVTSDGEEYIFNYYGYHGSKRGKTLYFFIKK